ncbi:3'5'-cyclic nucleotide phosphodiesterase [Coniochaeta sp. 2T2.1]|nr:3'5'-cyclic nucleotide phosphodiesterase [Coniochaeta sp. 2T2.1]
MEPGTCNVLYIDRNVREDRYLTSDENATAEDFEWETQNIAENVKHLLDVFGEVHLISKGATCMQQWLGLQDVSMVELKPTLLLIDTPYDDRIPERSRSRTPSPHSPPPIDEEEDHEEDLYGLALLERIVSESQLRSLSALVVPVPIVNFPTSVVAEDTESSSSSETTDTSCDHIAHRKLPARSPSEERVANRRMLKKCLDLGATDVMASPMNVKCITNLEVHAYRAHRDAAREQKAMLEVRRGRKRSWVGISDEKPYAYLREAMVSNLMRRICRTDVVQEEPIANVKVTVPAERRNRIVEAVASWHFCAHDFSEDELIVVSAVMFEHALSMPELEKWRIPTEQLHGFLIACRAAYNNFVPYHNFRHVVDVLQATFNFLVNIGALPPFRSAGHDAPAKSASASLIEPFEALTLLITAIGHDVGHPGVNNGFLTTLNAPLAQLYNDRSVLESFHCAAYSQILRRYWQAAFNDCKMRKLMISSILATDMGLHFEYMKKMGDAQDKFRAQTSTEGWDARATEAHKALVCALIIKCADISNVARRHDAALQWMHILSDEFSRQASMEEELQIPTSLMAPPKKDIVSLGKAQLGFMNLFALPLFQGVADLMPAMQYTVDELEANKVLFGMKVHEAENSQDPTIRMLKRTDGTFSPRTMSMAVTPDLTLEKQASPPTPTQRLLAASAPTVLETRTVSEQEFMTKPAEPVEKPATVPSPEGSYKEVNGLVTTFEAVADFAASDPFNVNDSGGGSGASSGHHSRPSGPEMNHPGHMKQRGSEATEGSSLPYTAEWASGATSATTGKMPLSPSTQGTSVISRDSMDRPVSVPVTTVTAPESITTAPESTKSRSRSNDLKTPSSVSIDDDRSHSSSNLDMHDSGTLRAPGDATAGQTLKKKPSRFRINGRLHFFRRHKAGSGTATTDAAG